MEGRVDERVNTVNALLVSEQQGIILLVEEAHPESESRWLSLRQEELPETELSVSLDQGQLLLKKMGRDSD